MSFDGDIPLGFKQTEIGPIPEDWEVSSIDDFSTVIDCKHVTAKFVSSGLPVASNQETQSKFINLSDANRTSRKFFDALREGGRDPRPGDLIMSRNATVGEVAMVSEKHPPFAMGQDISLIRPSPIKVSQQFLWQSLNAEMMKRQIELCMVGSTFKRINVQQIKSMISALPPLAEQQAIAKALSDVDGLIAEMEALLAKKRDLKQATAQTLLTGQTRLPGFDGAWREVKLGEVFRVCHGRSQKDVEVTSGSIPILGTGGRIGWASEPLHSGPSLLIGRKGTIDKPRYSDKPFWTVDTLFYTEFFEENVPKFFYYKALQIDWLRYNEASGVPSLSAKTIEKIEVKAPFPEELTAIAAVLYDMDAEIDALEAQLAKTRDLKTGMMQDLLTGRVRLIGTGQRPAQGQAA